MLLPTLVFGAKVESARVLKVRGEHNSFVTSLTGQLDTKIPSIQGNKHKVQGLGG